MKKWIACILVVVLSFSLFGCVSKMTAVENFLLATVKMDPDAMQAEMVPDESAGSVYMKLQNADLSDEALTALRGLYALVQYKVGEISSEGTGEKYVSVTVKVPDMERIRSLAAAQILVSGNSADEVIGEMLEDGSISQNMMKEYSVSVKMTETDGEWKIPYGDKANAEFAKILSLAEMIDFLN